MDPCRHSSYSGLPADWMHRIRQGGKKVKRKIRHNSDITQVQQLVPERCGKYERKIINGSQYNHDLCSMDDFHPQAECVGAGVTCGGNQHRRLCGIYDIQWYIHNSLLYKGTCKK